MPIRIDSQSADFASRFRAFLAMKREVSADVEAAARGQPRGLARPQVLAGRGRRAGNLAQGQRRGRIPAHADPADGSRHYVPDDADL